ncbi:MAG: hypothetical protein Kow00107_07550 [Planctomycetota bacterium]
MALFAYLAATIATVLPGPALTKIGVTPLTSIFMHVIEFLVLGGLTFLAAASLNVSRPILTALAVALPYAILNEAAQHFIPGRCITYPDIAVNTLSAAAGALIVWQLLASNSPAPTSV